MRFRNIVSGRRPWSTFDLSKGDLTRRGGLRLRHGLTTSPNLHLALLIAEVHVESVTLSVTVIPFEIVAQAPGVKTSVRAISDGPRQLRKLVAENCVRRASGTLRFDLPRVTKKLPASWKR